MTQLKKWNTDTEEWEPVIVGARGEGIPTGGTTGQVLRKASNDDFDSEWTNSTTDFSGYTFAQFDTLFE